MELNPADVQKVLSGTYPGELGIEVLAATSAGARGRLRAEARHLHPGGFVHGGVWVSLADTVAAWSTIPNLPEGANFSTAEMKVNLFGIARAGDVLEAESLPLHVGRRTQMWEVRVSVGKKLAALFTCTQVLVEQG